MTERNKFPSGWNKQRVQRVLEHYQSEEEAEAQDETMWERPDQTVMEIPCALAHWFAN